MSDELSNSRRGKASDEVDPEFYRCLFDNHPLPAWIYDPDSLVFLKVNSAATAEYQYTADEFLRMRCSDIRAPDHLWGLVEPTGEDSRYAAAEEHGCHRRKDGSILEATIYSREITLRGKPAHLAIVRNISEKQKLRRERRFFEAAVANASEAFLITDSNWTPPGPRIVFANAAFTAMTGYELRDVLGKSPGILRGPKSESISLERIAADLRTATSVLYESVNYRKDGSEYVVEWQVTPLRDESGVITHYLSIQRDNTERNRTQERVRQAQKMEAVGRLAGGVAHDFNNLLTIILGYSGLLAMELARLPGFDAKANHSLDEIQKAAEKAATLTSQLLVFSRKQVLRMRVIEINPVIADMENMLRRLIGEDIDLELSLGTNIDCVYADPGQLEHVLMNLAANARDAMPNGGTLTIETRNAQIASRFAGPVSIPESIKDGQYVVLSVTDTGSGMAEETRQRAFEPFFTTKESGKGTGLGLSMVYGFAQQCGGGIDLYSEPGRGASFRIYLPRTELAFESRSDEAQRYLLRGAGSILVVEDELAIRELVREVLVNAGYDVFTAANAREAIDFARLYSGRIDLLMSDVVLPGVSGPDLAAELKARNPALKVLFASGYSDHALLRQGTLQAGAEFVHKPFDSDTLLRKIAALMTPAVATNTQAG